MGGNNGDLNKRLLSKRQLIYRYIRDNGQASKQDLVIALKLSLPTVTQNLQYLTELGLVDTSKKIQNTGGRNATAYSYVKNARISIGIYLTRNHITVIAVDLLGNVVEKEKFRSKFDVESEEYLEKIGDAVTAIKDKIGLLEEQLLGVGIAVQSLVSADGEEVLYGRTLNFTGAKRTRIAQYIPYKNRLFHDSEVAGYAEVWINKSIKNAFYLSLNNSLGGAVIADDHLYIGDNLKSGEIGHMVAVREGGERCYCGQYGCFDTVLRATKLEEYTDGNLEQFFILLKEGDETAQRMWDKYLDELALAIHNVRMLFDSKVIIGGYIGAYIEEYLEVLAQKVDVRTPFLEDLASTYIVPCKYKVEAAAAGAAIYYINEFFDSI